MIFTELKQVPENSVPEYSWDAITTPELLTVDYLDQAFRSLSPNGKITLTVPVGNKSAKRNLMFAGFANVTSSSEDDKVIFTAEKIPVQAVTTSIKLNDEGETTEFGWGVDVNADADIIDENTLIEGTTVDAPTFDCGSADGPKKACKNCVCGLAQQEQTDAENFNPPSSGCGGCSKGDSFRCATCPFLGTPAWKEDSEKVKLDL